MTTQQLPSPQNDTQSAGNAVPQNTSVSGQANDFSPLPLTPAVTEHPIAPESITPRSRPATDFSHPGTIPTDPFMSQLPSSADIGNYIAGAEQEVANHRDYTVAQHLMYAPVGILAAAIDTPLRSLHIFTPDTMKNLMQSVGANNEANYYQQNQAGLSLIGDIAFAFVPGMLGAKAMEAGSLLFRAAEVSKIPFLTGLFANSEKLTAAMLDLDKTVQNAATFDRTVTFGLSNPEYAKAKWDLQIQAGSNAFKKYLGSEVATYLTMNASSNLYPSTDDMDLTSQLAMHAMFGILPVGAEVFATRKALRNTLLKLDGRVVTEPTGVESTEGTTFNRSRGLTTDALSAALYRDLQRNSGSDTALKSNSTKLDTMFTGSVKQILGRIANDGLPGLLESFQPSEQDLVSLTHALVIDPTAAPGLVGFTKVLGDPTQVNGLADLIRSTAQNAQSRLDGFGARLNKINDMYERMKPAKSISIAPTRNDIIAKSDYIMNAGLVIDPSEIKGLHTELKTLMDDVKGAGYKPDSELKLKAGRAGQLLKVLGDYHESQAQLEQLAGLSSTVMRADGTSIPMDAYRYSFADNTAHNSLSETLVSGRTTAGDPAVYGFGTTSQDANIIDPVTGKGMKVLINEHLNPVLPQGTSYTDLSPYHADAFQALGQRLIARGDFGIVLNQKNLIPPIDMQQANFFKLKLAKAAFNKNNDLVKMMRLPPGISGDNFNNWIDYQILAKGYDTYSAMAKDMGTSGVTTYDIAHRLMLPYDQLNQMSPVLDGYGWLYMQGSNDFNKEVPSIADFRRIVNSGTDLRNGLTAGGIAQTPEQLQTLQRSLPLMSNAFDRPLAKDGSFLASQMLFRKPVPYDMTATSMQQAAIADRIEFLGNFMKAPPSILSLVDKLRRSASFEVSQDVGRLVDGSQANWGRVPLSTEYSNRGNEVFQAINTISTLTDNHAFLANKAMLNTSATFGAGKDFSTLSGKLRNSENAGELFKFNQFVASKRFGFQLDDAVTPDGSFTLARNKDGSLTPRNQRAIRAFYPNGLPQGMTAEDITHMPAITGDKSYAPVQLGDLSKQLVQTWRYDINDPLYQAQSFFRKLVGRSDINYDNWHIPPQNLQGKHVRYIVLPQDQGNPIKYAVWGNTGQELESRWNQPAIQKILKENHAVDSMIVDQGDVEAYHELHDEMFHGLVNFADPFGQTAATTGAQGNLLQQFGTQSLDDLARHAELQNSSIAKRTVASLYHDEIRKAGMLNSMYRDSSTISGVDKWAPSIWQSYQDTLMGTPALRSKNDLLAVDARNDSKLLNGVFSTAIENLRNILPPVANVLSSVASPGTEAEFNKLRTLMGGSLPFKDAADFAANTFKVGTPKSIENYMHTLTAVTANLSMRILDAGNGLLSILSNTVAMPVVMNSLKRQNFANGEDYDAIVKSFGIPVGQDYAMPSFAKIGAKAVGWLFGAEGHQMIDDATNKYGTIRDTMVAAHDAFHKPFESSYQSSANKLLTFLSLPSDKGENLARTWAYGTGYLLARDGYKVAEDVDRHNFANWFANQTIANYRPANKPLMFQGILGTPLGLFQTYMMNYYGRVFKYIENRDYRTLAVNYALQGSLFGMQTVPGWKQFNDLYTHGHDGRADIVDSLNERYGPNLTNGLLYGAFSNIPKIFGADGVSLYSRADTNLSKIPSFMDPANSPVISFFDNVFGAAGKLIDQARTGGQWSAQQTLETLGSMSMNRFTSRMMEVAAGVSTDQQGNVINDHVRGAMSVSSRLLGLRPLSENIDMQAYARLSSHQQYQDAIQNRISRSMRSILRSDPSSAELDKAFSSAIGDYMKAGGNPSGIGEFINNTYLSALMTKNDKKLIGIMRNPSRTQDVLRLYNNSVDFNAGGALTQ